MTDATKVSVGSPNVAGGVAIGALDATLPTDAGTALDSSIVRLGYASDEGVEATGDAASIAELFAWGGDLVAAPTEKKATRKYRFTLIEVYSQSVNEFVFGTGNVTAIAAGAGKGSQLAISDTATDPDDSVVVFELAYKGKKKRVVCPNASVSIIGENSLVDNDVEGFQCEITCKPDSSGNYRYIYTEDSDVAA